MSTQPEPEARVKDPFGSMTEPEIREAVKGLHDELDGILTNYKNAETGDVNWHDLKGEEARKVFDINQKMTLAQTRFETLSKLKGAAHVSEQLNRFLNEPADRPLPAPIGDRPKRLPDLGKAFVQSAAYKAMTPGATTPEVEFDAAFKITLGEDDTLPDVDDLFPVESTRVGVIVDTLYQPNNIGPLIPTIPTSQPLIKFLRETVNATGAAETNEGALAPEASIDWAEDSVPVEKIAVAHALTEELAADEQAIRSIVNTRLRLFVNNREDLQLLQGDGVSPNLRGILNTAGVQNVNSSLAGTDQAKLEAVHNAKTLVMEAFQTPTAVIGTAGTWEQFRLAKDGNLNYLLGPAGDSGVQRVWGLPFVSNQNMQEFDTISNVPLLVGDFTNAASIFRRQGVSVAITDSHADEFMRGILRVRMTTRLALVVWRPTGFATVTAIA